VATSETRVRAVGTQFDVYHKRSGTVVTVVEGRVAVNPMPRNTRDMAPGPRSTDAQRSGSAATMRPPELLVTAGEQVTVTPAEVAPPAQVNTAVVTAWTEKKLIFESAPLREVVEEFNRYNRQQLVIRDPELLDFHVSGVFPSTDSRRMIEFLRQRFGVTMNDSDGQIEIHRRDNPKPSVGETKTF
jgi:transmembrane sensor